MIIYKKKKAVVLKLREPTKVTTAIPTAKVFRTPSGQELVGVPHRPDETNVLRNLGFDVPSPMDYYYPYKAKFTPFDSQRVTSSFMSMNKRCFVLNSMGLGKTITTLWAIDYLRSVKQIKKVLVVCPISVMERTWGDEIFRNFPNLEFRVLYGTKAKRVKLLAEEADIYIINPDGVRTIKDELAEREDIDLVVIDEVALFRTYGTARWKTLDAVCNKQCPRKVWGLTGSPTPNSPTDAYGQIKLVVPTAPGVPKYFGRFRDLVMRQVSQFKWEPKADAMDTVYKLLQPAVRFNIDDCIDLPEQVTTYRSVEMTAEQKKAYRDMKEALRTELESGEVLAVNEAVKASKLLQICCGGVYDINGQTQQIPCESRLQAVTELVEESEGKVIVFVPFTGTLHYVKDHLVAQGYESAVVEGATSKDDRDNIFHEFQNGGSLKVIVANPTTMSHGLTLTAATTIVWYGPSYSNEVYQQACARVRRPGQTRMTVIAHLVSTPFEEKIYKRLTEKQSMQGILLEMIRDNLG